MAKITQLVFTLAALVLVAPAHAALSASANGDDCPQQGIKAKGGSHAVPARSACAETLPAEIELKEAIDYKEGQLSYRWCDTGSDSVSVCLERNDSAFEITRARLLLTEKPCGEPAAPGQPSLYRFMSAQEAGQPVRGQTFTARAADAKRVQCLYATFYGVRKEPN